MSPAAVMVLLVIACLAAAGVVAAAVKVERDRRLSRSDGDVGEIDTEKRGPRRHSHQWRYHSSEFNDASRMTSFKNVEPDTLMQLLHGFTNITYTCAVDECPEVRVERHAGRISDPFPGKEYKPE